MKKILIVAMADSVHTARWIRQFDSDEIEFVLFPSTPHRRIHGLIGEHKQVKRISSLRISRFMTIGALPLGILDLLFKNFFRSKFLAREIKTFQPDIIHIMETQHSGYLAYKALKKSQTNSKIILSIWGSDLFWFQKFKRHRSKISSVLKMVDLLVMECNRDRETALGLGFGGTFSVNMPATGGLNTGLLRERALEQPTVTRKLIAVKGYSGFVGLGTEALKVIELVESEINEFSVMVYSAGLRTLWQSRGLRKSMGERIQVVRKHKLSNLEIEEMFLKSRVSLGLSLSDGLPATVKEAMCTGAIPIQTSTSCAGEWFADGIGGHLVNEVDIQGVADALLIALRDNSFAHAASEINYQIAEQRFSEAKVREQSRSLYFL